MPARSNFVINEKGTGYKIKKIARLANLWEAKGPQSEEKKYVPAKQSKYIFSSMSGVLTPSRPQEAIRKVPDFSLLEKSIETSLLDDATDREVKRKIRQVSKGHLEPFLEDVLGEINEYFENAKSNAELLVNLREDPQQPDFNFVEIFITPEMDFETFEEAMQAEDEIGERVERKIEDIRNSHEFGLEELNETEITVVPLLLGINNLPPAE